MSSSNESTEKRSAHSRILLILANLISVAFLIWALRDVDARQLSREVAGIEWPWIAFAVVTDILVYFWHGWRWSLLLSPVTYVSFWKSVRAIYVGLFANEVLPFRTGEVIRCYLLSRWTSLPLSVSLSSALIERIFDGIWLIICLFITIKVVKLPAKYVDAGVLLSVLVFAAIVLLGAAMFFKESATRAFRNNKVLSKLIVVLEDLNLIGHSKYLYFSAFASLPYLLMQVLPVWGVANAYPGLDLDIGEATVLMVILRLGSVVPQAPGNVGLYQALTIAGMEILGFDRGISQRFSVMLWSVVTLPLLVAGFVALAITGMRISELRKHAQSSVDAQTSSE